MGIGHLQLILWKICSNSNCQSLSLNLDAGPENFLLYYAYLSCIFLYKLSRVLSLLCFCSVLLWRVEPLAFTTAELSSCKFCRSYSLGFFIFEYLRKIVVHELVKNSLAEVVKIPHPSLPAGRIRLPPWGTQARRPWWMPPCPRTSLRSHSLSRSSLHLFIVARQVEQV